MIVSSANVRMRLRENDWLRFLPQLSSMFLGCEEDYATTTTTRERVEFSIGQLAHCVLCAMLCVLFNIAL